MDKNAVNPTALSFDAMRLPQWYIERMITATSVQLQRLMYCRDLLPEQLEALCIVKMQELNAYSKIRNISELFGSGDALSEVRLNNYNVEHFLNAIVGHILKLTSAHSVNISAVCGANSKYAVFDLRRTSLILSNLISNSLIHVNKKEKDIVVNAFKDGGSLVISVRDNGDGIPVSAQKRLFSAYENVIAKTSNFTEKDFMLSGLGLAISRKSARDMGGDVIYAGSKVNGTEFRLEIPQNQDFRFVSEAIIAEPDYEEIDAVLAGAMLCLMQEDKT